MYSVAQKDSGGAGWDGLRMVELRLEGLGVESYHPVFCGVPPQMCWRQRTGWGWGKGELGRFLSLTEP